jgi:hypothetical protein
LPEQEISVTNLPQEEARQYIFVDGDFGCVKFIKQVAAEYDFNIAATKVMFSPI